MLERVLGGSDRSSDGSVGGWGGGEAAVTRVTGGGCCCRWLLLYGVVCLYLSARTISRSRHRKWAQNMSAVCQCRPMSANRGNLATYVVSKEMSPKCRRHYQHSQPRRAHPLERQRSVNSLWIRVRCHFCQKIVCGRSSLRM